VSLEPVIDIVRELNCLVVAEGSNRRVALAAKLGRATSLIRPREGIAEELYAQTPTETKGRWIYV
jgi:hypothetical protein